MTQFNLFVVNVLTGIVISISKMVNTTYRTPLLYVIFLRKILKRLKIKIENWKWYFFSFEKLVEFVVLDFEENPGGLDGLQLSNNLHQFNFAPKIKFRTSSFIFLYFFFKKTSIPVHSNIT